MLAAAFPERSPEILHLLEILRPFEVVPELLVWTQEKVLRSAEVPSPRALDV